VDEDLARFCRDYRWPITLDELWRRIMLPRPPAISRDDIRRLEREKREWYQANM
jgi:hypothetical protein